VVLFRGFVAWMERRVIRERPRRVPRLAPDWHPGYKTTLVKALRKS